MSLIRDAWCAVLRQCCPFDWYVLRCVCRVLYQLVPASLIRRCYRAPWLLKHAVRRDSVSLLEWLHARRHLPQSYDLLLQHAARHNARAALGWLLADVFWLQNQPPQEALCKAARRGHLDVLVQLDAMLPRSRDSPAKRHQQQEQANVCYGMLVHTEHTIAVHGGHLHVLHWLQAQYGIVQVSTQMYRVAIRARHYAVLHWLRSIDSTQEYIDDATFGLSPCVIAARAGDLRALALLWERDAVVRATLLDTQRWPDAALLRRVRDVLHSSPPSNSLRCRQVLRCATVHDHVEAMCTQALQFRSACKWAHICSKHGAVRILRWLAAQQPVHEWHADPHWPQLCDTAARHGHLRVLRVLRHEFAVPPPWLADTMQHVALYAPKHCTAETLEYCAANGATLQLRVKELAQLGRVEALRWALARGIAMPSTLCDTAATARQYAVMHLLHEAGACPWRLEWCMPTTLHVRDAARLLAPHLCTTV